jgi:hypothetical protein
MQQISSHYYFALGAGYAAALLAWLLVDDSRPDIWGHLKDPRFRHPWWETVAALIASLATVGIGLLYSRHLLLPEVSATKSPVINALNQVIIFSPFITLLLVRRQSLQTAWLPATKILLRLGAGAVLAGCALLVFYFVSRPPVTFLTIFASVYHPKNFGYAVQIFLEDFAIAILFVRLRDALGQKRFLIAVLAVAFLFSAAHYPDKLAQGQLFLIATREVTIDAFLVGGVVYFLQRSKDFLWFWCVHFTMDMLQFYTGGAIR